MNALQKSLQTGYRYMQLWPMDHPELAIRFHDVRAARINRHAIRHMPWLAMLTVTLGYGFGQPSVLPHMLASAALMASLPVQGLLWLGHRAKSVLEPHDRRWYRQLIERMEQQGVEAPERQAPDDDEKEQSNSPLTYWDLARLVNFAFCKTEQAFKR